MNLALLPDPHPRLPRSMVSLGWDCPRECSTPECGRIAEPGSTHCATCLALASEYDRRERHAIHAVPPPAAPVPAAEFPVIRPKTSIHLERLEASLAEMPEPAALALYGDDAPRDWRVRAAVIAVALAGGVMLLLPLSASLPFVAGLAVAKLAEFGWRASR